MKKVIAALAIIALAITQAGPVLAQTAQAAGVASPRERLLMDTGWRFAFGNATDPSKDFDPSVRQQQLFRQGRQCVGAAATDFDDRAWRTLNLPHDWAVELPFDSRGAGSHGYKAIGRNFPQNSVGWYRKSFAIPNSDLGKKISLEFDGVFRDSIVWVNGFYLGQESSGYASFSYDITDYLNYGGNNVVAVRVDASLEEGWFYEGAGIYRHVWLTKTAPLHVAHWGAFVSTEVKTNSAAVTARATIANEGTNEADFFHRANHSQHRWQNRSPASSPGLSLEPGVENEFTNVLAVSDPNLVVARNSLPCTNSSPRSRSGGTVVDRYETPFGIRTHPF